MPLQCIIIGTRYDTRTRDVGPEAISVRASLSFLCRPRTAIRLSGHSAATAAAAAYSIARRHYSVSSSAMVLSRELLVATFLLLLLGAAQAVRTLYVTPSANTTCRGEPCLTLNQYAESVSQYFTDDTELVFLSGSHFLGQPFIVRDLEAVLFLHQESTGSEKQPEIACTEPVSIIFTNISQVSVSKLTFSGCGDNQRTSPTLLASSVQGFTMTNSIMKYSQATAVTILESYNVTLSGNIFESNSGCEGGAIHISNSMMEVEKSHFRNNTAESGGALYVYQGTVLFRESNTFTVNRAFNGGAVFLNSSSVAFNGSQTFWLNSAFRIGGVIHGVHSNLSFDGTSNFTENISEGNGSTLQMSFSVIRFGGSALFVRNIASLFYGSLAYIECSVDMVGTFIFDSNIAGSVGALYITGLSNVTVSGKVVFINNSAAGLATAVNVHNSSLSLLGTTVFSSNTACGDGTAALFVSNSTVLVGGIATFMNNTGYVGAAVYLLRGSVVLMGTHRFEHNVASFQGGAIYIVDGTVHCNGECTFIGNYANRQGGAISAANGDFDFIGNSSFINNHASFGGALYLEFTSALSLGQSSALLFQNNSAERGAAIFFSDTTNSIFCFNIGVPVHADDLSQCFLRINPSVSVDSVALTFENNTVNTLNGGESIFGGMFNKCLFRSNTFFIDDINFEVRGGGLDLLRNIIKTRNGTKNFNALDISSGPLRLCFCQNNTPDCLYQYPPFDVVRGASISVSVAALNQVSHLVAAYVRGYLLSDSSSFGSGQYVQQIGISCTDLNFTVLSTEPSATLILYAQGPCRDSGISPRNVTVKLEPCPLAFELSASQCICTKKLQKYTNTCSIESESFQRSGSFWVGSDYDNGSYTGLVIHPHCPFDYCQSDTADISFNDLDSQCAFSREGVLCGSCQGNLSLSLGSSRCMECSNSYLALLFPFAAAGIVLVLLLFLLRLTVSVGTLSGLIFYANIVAVNRAIFFPPGATNILTVFISWLNLDLGIETCFYSGMDAYGRTWLQFVFPGYILLLAFLIIVVSHYSVKFSTIIGHNPISVLATLLVLSYAKLLRIIIAAFSATVLAFPDNTTRTVWLFDGSVGYLVGKHIPLFLVSTLFVLFLFLPYTLFLFLGQWLQALSDKKVFYWMNDIRIKIFLDTYHAPYQAKHRYWPGLLLLLRCVLFLVFASNILGDPSNNLLAVTSVSLGLMLFPCITDQIYSKRLLDILEGSFILNLGMLAAATHHVMQTGGNQAAVTYLSVSIAFTEFLAIVVYHVYLQMKGTKVWDSALTAVRNKWKLANTQMDSEAVLHHDTHSQNTTDMVQTFTDLREPLLEYS